MIETTMTRLRKLLRRKSLDLEHRGLPDLRPSKPQGNAIGTLPRDPTIDRGF